MTTSEMRSRGWGIGPVFLAALFALACGGGDDGPGGSSAGGEDFEETGSMRALADGERAPPLPDGTIGEHHDIAAEVSGLNPRAARPPVDTQEMYRRLAPATVIVRSTSTMGTGVVVGPNGLILTNNHVIRHAEHENFRMRVTVEYGELGENGSMVADGEQRPAWVLARDVNRDMAILRVENPPGDRPVVGLSATDPTPGEGVITIGNGDVGLVWAIRRCEVEATGRLEDSYARLAALCGTDDRMAAAECERLRERMHADMRGLMVQSSCPLAPGDSGGPLVDTEGNLVGLNVMTVRNERGQWSNFHVHVREMRDFLQTVPSEPLTQLPTPFIEHQFMEEMDQDLDGRFDTVVMRGREGMTSLVDLDQDTPDGAVANLEQRVEQHGFDAEVAVVMRPPHRFVWYDTTGDGELDLVLTLDPMQRVSAAHTVRDGRPVEANVEPGPGLLASRVAQPLRQRFERIFHAHLNDAPDPLPALLRTGDVRDSDHDGTPDTLHGQRALVHAVAHDVDQNSLTGVSREQVDELVRSGRFDAELSLVYRDPVLYTFYDRDDDGQFDTGMRTAPMSSVVAAVVPLQGGTPPDINDVLGTLAVRPDWFGERAAAVRTMTQANVVDSWIPLEQDFGGLPHPVHHHAQINVRASYDEDGWENHVLRFAHDGFITSLVDVDRNAWRGRNRRYRDDLSAAVRDDHFSAEFAVISTRGAFWAWYDRDADGEWDLCLVQVDDHPNPRHNAFERQRDGTFAHAPALVSGRPVRPELLRRRDRARFATMARAYFSEALVAPDE